MEQKIGKNKINSIETFNREIVLRDGTRMRMRSIKPEDREILLAMLRRCSPESLRYRFFRIIKDISENLLDGFPALDGSRHIALVVLPLDYVEQRICAVGRYIVHKHKNDVAEVSFLVEDAMQERGIGTIL